MSKVKIALYPAGALIVVLAIGSIVKNWYSPSPAGSQTQWTAPQVIKEVVKIQTVTVPGPPQIITIEKEKVVEKLKLSDEIAKDPDKQIVATAKIAPYEGSTHVVSTMDTKTGQGSIMAKQEPLPFLQFLNEKEIGVSARGVAGIGGFNQEIAADGRWTFVRVGPARMALTAEVTSRSEARGGLRIYTRW